MKTITYMYPKNHNTTIPIIVGNYDKETKGRAFVELNYPNAYIKQQFASAKEFETKEEVNVYCEKLIQTIEKNQKDSDRDFENERTGILTVYKDKKAESIKIPNCPVNVLFEGDNVLITIYATIDEIKTTDIQAMFLDFSNDPSPCHAGQLVSLGYYVWRFEAAAPKLINTNPIQFVCEKATYNSMFSRPCRRIAQWHT